MFFYLTTYVFAPLKKDQNQRRNQHPAQGCHHPRSRKSSFCCWSLKGEEASKPRKLISQLSDHSRKDPRSCLSPATAGFYGKASIRLRAELPEGLGTGDAISLRSSAHFCEPMSDGDWQPCTPASRMPPIYPWATPVGRPGLTARAPAQAAGGASPAPPSPKAPGRWPGARSPHPSAAVLCRPGLFWAHPLAGGSSRVLCEGGKCKGRREGGFVWPPGRRSCLPPTRPCLRWLR